MRTTIDLDEELLRTAKTIAAAKDQTLSQVITELAWKGLKPPARTYKRKNGFPVLPATPGSKPYTVEHVKELAALYEDGRLADELIR